MFHTKVNYEQIKLLIINNILITAMYKCNVHEKKKLSVNVL